MVENLRKNKERCEKRCATFSHLRYFERGASFFAEEKGSDVYPYRLCYTLIIKPPKNISANPVYRFVLKNIK